MAVFPSIKPIYGEQITVNQNARIVKLGDGYESSSISRIANDCDKQKPLENSNSGDRNV